jgi:hypothetical protein
LTHPAPAIRMLKVRRAFPKIMFGILSKPNLKGGVVSLKPLKKHCKNKKDVDTLLLFVFQHLFAFYMLYAR